MSKSLVAYRPSAPSLKTTMGGGSIAPAVAAHLKKSQPDSATKEKARTPAPGKASQFGGGAMAPSVARHLKG